MNWLQDENLPGELKMAFYIALGLAVGMPVIALPEGVLQTIGKLPYMSPNWLSIWRFPVTWLGYALYFTGNVIVGFPICAFAFALDRMDGAVAAALVKLNDPSYPGKTEVGKWLDPLIDKLTLTPLLTIFYYKGLLWPTSTAILIVAEMFGTMIRPPFELFLQNHIRGNESSGVGKVKVVAQYVCMFICFSLDQHWMENTLIANIGMIIVDICSILSVMSRLRINKKIDAIVDWISKHFEHKK